MRKPTKRETSPRFAEKPREVFARAPWQPLAPMSEREPTPAYEPKQIKRFAAGNKSYTWRLRGGMAGAPASSLGTVPQAFFR